jgi:hypothetical protein
MLIEWFIEELIILFCRSVPVSTEVNSICFKERETVQNKTDLIISLRNTPHKNEHGGF